LIINDNYFIFVHLNIEQNIEGKIMKYRSPEATVGAIITKVDHGTRFVLLALRNTEPYKNFWSIPGGHIDAFETAEHAVIREIKEEVGMDIQPEYLFYFDEIILEKNIHAVVQVFYASANGSIKVAEDEILEARWASLQEALSMELAFLHHQIIRQYANNLEMK
jgi:8-oxo-dGTP diphosphatase